MRFPVRRPRLPTMPQLPSMPSMPQLPSLSSLPSLPALPDLPAVTAVASGLSQRVQRLRAVVAGGESAAEADAFEDALRAEGILVDNYRPSNAFVPRRAVQNGSVQTMLARRRPLDSVARRLEQPILIDAGPDATGADPERQARLMGYYNPRLSSASHRGLVLLIHGWEGHSHSADLLFVADALLRSGYSTFRLNLRDHGPNLHVDRLALNRGLFIGTLLGEVHAATQQIAQLAGDHPFYMVGGSMGGNFVLRMAERHNHEPIPNLAKVVAVCPAVNPAAAVDAIDQQTVYRAFFRARWLASLKGKQRRFPDRYDFRELERVARLREMTDLAIPQHSQWKSADDYFAHYGFDNEMAQALRTPTTIVATVDDRVIPVHDIYRLQPHDNLKVHIHRVGGHMGFVDILPYRRWLPGAVLEELSE